MGLFLSKRPQFDIRTAKTRDIADSAERGSERSQGREAILYWGERAILWEIGVGSLGGSYVHGDAYDRVIGVAGGGAPQSFCPKHIF
jgi:hypothetical protein